jgi:hypothetical protein
LFCGNHLQISPEFYLCLLPYQIDLISIKDFSEDIMETAESSFELYLGIFAVLLLSGMFLRRRR